MGQRSERLRKAALLRDGYRCVACGVLDFTTEGLEVDHITPLSRGGENSLSNLRTLCIPCHRRATLPVRRATMERLNHRRRGWVAKYGKRPSEAPPGLL